MNTIVQQTLRVLSSLWLSVALLILLALLTWLGGRQSHHPPISRAVAALRLPAVLVPGRRRAEDQGARARRLAA